MDVGKIFGLDRLDGIISRLERRPLRIYAGQCLMERDRTVECDSCVSQCPVEAIDLSAGVEVDFESCVDCGICVSACPTGVFESRVSEDTFLGKIKQKVGERDDIGFSCTKQLAEFGPQRNVPEVEVPCLGRLTETMLVGAAAFGAGRIWLNLRGCAECDRQLGVVLAREMVQGVDRLLEAWGHPVEFSLAEEPVKLESDPDRGADDDVEEYDRRELLTKFGREMLASGLGLAEGRADRLADLFDPPSEEHFAYRVPRRRELFLRLTKKMGQPNADMTLSDGLPLYGLTFDESSCNFCGNCAAFCPTKALEISRKTTSAELSFTLSRCLGCDLCLQVCHPRSLAANPRISLQSLFAEQTRSLSEQNYRTCPKCMQEFASAADQEMCDFCRLREEKLQDDSWS